MMKWNMGSTDRALRLALAIILAILVYNEVITGIFSSLMLGLAVILFITSTIGVCPLYFPFKISTRKKYAKQSS
jgi:hypothetical protein